MTAPSTSETIIETRGLDLWYGAVQALKGITIPIRANRVMALIGPSGCGQSTLLRCFNRMNDLVPDCRVEGSIRYHGDEIAGPAYDVVELRKRVGLVFQKPNPFPKSVYENVAYGPRVHGEKDRGALDAIVERSLRRAALWD